MLAENIQPVAAIVEHRESVDDLTWSRYFSINQAVNAVDDHIRSLPSDATPEKHTRKAYTQGLNYWFMWSHFQLTGNLIKPDNGDFAPLPHALPSVSLMRSYIAHLTNERESSISTIRARYLPVLVNYFKALGDQVIEATTGAEFVKVSEWRIHIQAACNVKRPQLVTKSNIAPLWRHRRLSLQEVNAVLRQQNRETLSGKRNYALLRVAFETGLRVAELTRMTPETVTIEDKHVIITVRGKGGKVDPVPISNDCYNAIQQWITSYNDGLEDEDERRIQPNHSLWQPLQYPDKYRPIGKNNYDPQRGITVNAIQDVIKRETKRATGEALPAHGTRRTVAALLYDAGMELPQISTLLRHGNSAVTLGYIGRKPDYKANKLINFVKLG